MEDYPSMDDYLAQAPAPSLSGQPPHAMSEREIEALDAEALARKEEALRRMNAALDAEMPDLAEVDGDKVYVDCGGSVLRSINFTWRDHSGNLVPLGEHDWSAQLCFGFPQN